MFVCKSMFCYTQVHCLLSQKNLATASAINQEDTLNWCINEYQFSTFEGLPTTFEGSSNVCYNTVLLIFVTIGANTCT